MNKFQNKYRIETTRLKEWNYSTPWWYYVTINTKNHFEFLGEIVKGKMVLNELGKVVEKCWEEIPQHFKNVELDYYVIMPNHIHGIIIINPSVETGYIPSPNKQQAEPPYMASLPLGDIIGKFKAAVKRWANKNGYNNFSWQSRFYDRIIRNEKELFNIRNYIEQNPNKWEIEKDKPENIYE